MSFDVAACHEFVALEAVEVGHESVGHHRFDPVSYALPAILDFVGATSGDLGWKPLIWSVLAATATCASESSGRHRGRVCGIHCVW